MRGRESERSHRLLEIIVSVSPSMALLTVTKCYKPLPSCKDTATRGRYAFTIEEETSRPGRWVMRTDVTELLHEIVIASIALFFPLVILLAIVGV